MKSRADRFRDAWNEYERFKREYLEEHPEASPEQYEQAMKEKAKELNL